MDMDREDHSISAKGKELTEDGDLADLSGSLDPERSLYYFIRCYYFAIIKGTAIVKKRRLIIPKLILYFYIDHQISLLK